jgi:large subunit ribosomal protein L3
MIGLLGKKLGQTRVYDAQGNLVAVTVVLAGPNRVLQCKTKESDGYAAVQLGFGDQKEHRVGKARMGHVRKHNGAPVRRIREFRGFSLPVKPGDVLGPAVFTVGDFVDAIGTTKGRGFEGVVKRHGFRGGDMTHGAKGWHRRSGAIGQRLFPGTVMRGLKMPGHMGQVRRTVQNLEVIQILESDNLILVKGAIPGAAGDYVVLRESKKIPRTVVEARRKALAEAAKAKQTGKAGAKGAK